MFSHVLLYLYVYNVVPIRFMCMLSSHPHRPLFVAFALDSFLFHQSSLLEHNEPGPILQCWMKRASSRIKVLDKTGQYLYYVNVTSVERSPGIRN